MGIFGWIFYFILGIVFFFILLVFQNKYSITNMEKLLLSIILLMISAGICYQLAIPYTDNLFLVFVFLMIVDVIYSSYFIERDFFNKNDRNITYYIVLVLIGFYINQEFINQVSRVFLTGEDLRIILWTGAFLFLYYFCRNRGVFANVSSFKEKGMNQESILIQYAKLKCQYYDECNVKDRDLSNLLYAIMIFENHRRNSFLRKYDYFVFRLNGNKAKLGIMQVESSKYITDSESIEIVSKKLQKIAEKKNSKKKITVEEIIENYDKNNAKEIQFIFDIIKKF